MLAICFGVRKRCPAGVEALSVIAAAHAKLRITDEVLFQARRRLRLGLAGGLWAKGQAVRLLSLQRKLALLCSRLVPKTVLFGKAVAD